MTSLLTLRAILLATSISCWCKRAYKKYQSCLGLINRLCHQRYQCKELEMSLASPWTVYAKLQRLTATLDVFKSRVEFVVLAFKYRLVSEITSYELWDRGYEGLGEREFDACFEMNDSEEVIA